MCVPLAFKTRMGRVITPYADWPRWLQVAVMLPNCVLSYFVMFRWWPKTKREWRRTEIALANMIVSLLVLIYVFHMH